MWPYHLGFFVSECDFTDLGVQAVLSASIHRAWTPHKGGLPPIEEKPLNRCLDIKLTLHLTFLVGPEECLHISEPEEPFEAQARARQAQPPHASGLVQGRPGLPHAVVGFAGFGFWLEKVQSGEKYNHRGRYIGRLRFHWESQTYEAESGQAQVAAATQVWVPDTVADAQVRYVVQPRMVQLGEGGGAFENTKVQGSLCANSHDAPWFSRWNRCGLEHTGPEQSSHAVALRLP